ncbi:MAG: hypothetical protein QOH51_1812 [Acidobacteriota bacterium]|jgi:hypothetical protein|nr:hypothetical protein [Acidobacteriota bacterium]
MRDEEWDDNVFPMAYLVTFRCYGSWLHGDERGSVDVHGKNIFGTPDIASNPKLKGLMQKELKNSPFLLDQKQRRVVEESIREVCRHRGYTLQAVNARSNHVHAVVSAQSKPELIINAFKAYATRKLREMNLLPPEISP